METQNFGQTIEHYAQEHSELYQRDNYESVRNYLKECIPSQKLESG